MPSVARQLRRELCVDAQDRLDGLWGELAAHVGVRVFEPVRQVIDDVAPGPDRRAPGVLAALRHVFEAGR
jgi:hypothetical protein